MAGGMHAARLRFLLLADFSFAVILKLFVVLLSPLSLTENDNWRPVPGAASCYFPIELQGEYAMQSSVAAPGGPVQYSQVNITAEAILPIWGHCHRRLGNNVILTDR
jgi:hypothetical protein